MARKSKCKGEGCEKELTKEEKYIDSGKSYCKDCYDKISHEKDNYKILIGTICQYFRINEPTGLMVKQIKQYKTEYGYSNSGIGYTLWYLKEIEGKSFNETKYGIALVKYNYEKARNYFEQQQRIQSSVNVEEVKVKQVKLKLNEVYKKNNDKFTFDINELLGGE